MPEGKVKWFNPRKGYGFIAADDGKDIFVHYANIASDGYKTLNEGDSVSFDIVEGEKGPRAENVVAQSASVSAKATPDESASSEKAEEVEEAVVEEVVAEETEATEEVKKEAEVEELAEEVEELAEEVEETEESAPQSE